jgi:N-acetylmuramic acid 6-phosphate etherase
MTAPAPAPLPADRGHVATEQRHPDSHAFDALATGDAIALMIGDHRRVAEAVGEAGPALAALIDDLVPRLADGGRLVYVGAGTSGRLGVLDAAECPPTFHSDPGRVVGVIAGGDAALRRSSEGLEDDPAGARDALDELDLGPRDTVLGIAAGATTPYVLGAIEIARGRGAATGLLTCSPPRGDVTCDHLIVLATGPELLTGSTRLKAGSATKLALNVITTIVHTRLGHVHGNLMVDLRATNDKLRDRALRILVEVHPDLDRPAAAGLLDRATGRLKRAIVMHARGGDADDADAVLARHAGSLRGALSEGDGAGSPDAPGSRAAAGRGPTPDRT